MSLGCSGVLAVVGFSAGCRVQTKARKNAKSHLLISGANHRRIKNPITTDGTPEEWYSPNNAVVVESRRFTPNRITFDVRSQVGGELIISQGCDSGWRITGDGKAGVHSNLVSIDIKPAQTRAAKQPTPAWAPAVCAGIAIWLTSTTDDHLVELALSTVLAYGSFLIAEDFHASGVLSTLTAGILIGNS